MKKKLSKLKDVRNAIDKLDDKILPLMIKRSQLVENALELKKLKAPFSLRGFFLNKIQIQTLIF